MSLTRDRLYGIARVLAIPGRSGLLKAELEETIMQRQDGRKNVYQELERDWAAKKIDDILATGSYLLPKPDNAFITPDGEFRSKADLAAASCKQGRLSDGEKAYRKAKAEYLGRMTALKAVIIKRRLDNVRWFENAEGISFAVLRNAEPEKKAA